MAALRQDKRSNKWCLRFRYAGEEYNRSCRTSNHSVAQRILGTVEDTIERLQTGRLEIPDDVDVGSWIVSGGKVVKKRIERQLSLSEICTQYTADQRQKAASTLYQESTHIGHFERILRPSIPLSDITLQKLKKYVQRRSKEEYRGRVVSSATIRKELVTFRQIWIWAQRNGHTNKTCPLLGPDRRWEIQLSKPVDRMKFQTWAQIERRINRGGLTDKEITALWRGLFLDEDQIQELLAIVEEKAAFAFIYPMFMFAAYTGARRSEIMRSQIDDIDLETDQVLIRERKRRKHLAASSRFVPLHPKLKSVLTTWFAVHPGGQYTIACEPEMPRRRPMKEACRLSRDQATHHFRHTLRKSKWQVVSGFHVLRHSFGSNLARSGAVPSEVIAEWMGHSTEEMKRLYRHLFPQDGVAHICVLK